MSDQDTAPVSGEPDRKLPRYTKADLVRIVDEFGRDHFWTPEGRAVCGRKRKEKNSVIEDERCLAPPMPNGACVVHGGKSGRPIESGRYARITTKWKAAFERARNDRELLDARADVAMMDVVLEQLVQRAEELDTSSWREELKETHLQLQRAIKSQRQDVAGTLLKKLGRLIEDGARAEQVSADLLAHVDRRAARACKLTEIEIRRAEKVSVDELAAIFKQGLGVLERELEPVVYYKLIPALRNATTTRLSLDSVGEEEDQDRSAG